MDGNKSSGQMAAKVKRQEISAEQQVSDAIVRNGRVPTAQGKQATGQPGSSDAASRPRETRTP